MLELILTRAGEQGLRSSIFENLRWLVFDELHMYRGRQSADARIGSSGASRAAVVRSAHVREKHTVFLCRCRNVIAQPGDTARIVAEEMLLWGYAGFPEAHA